MKIAGELRCVFAVVAAILIVAGCGTTPQSSDHSPPGARLEAPKDASSIALKLVRVRVTRERWEAGVAASTRDAVWQPPGPTLTLDLEADLPDRTFVSRTIALDACSAQDSTGKDLVGAWLSHSTGDRIGVFTDMVHPVVPRSRVLKWTVAVPASAARSVRANLSARVLVRTGAEKVVVRPSADWARFPHDTLDGTPIEYRSVHLVSEGIQFRPASALQVILRVDPWPSPAGLPRGPSARDKDSVFYPVRPVTGEPLSVTVATGLREIRVELPPQEVLLP